MDGYSVDPPVLEAFAVTSDGRAADLTEIRSTMGDVRVSRDGFGHIPILGTTVYNAYDDYVAEVEEAVTAAAGAMSAVASGMRAVVIDYTEGDRGAGDDLTAFEGAIEGIDFFGSQR